MPAMADRRLREAIERFGLDDDHELGRTPEGLGLLLPGVTVGLLGEPGSGLTTLATAITADLARSGHRVVYVAGDGNRRTIVERLVTLGLGSVELSYVALLTAEESRHLVAGDEFATLRLKAKLAGQYLLLDNVRGLLIRAGVSTHSSRLADLLAKRLPDLTEGYDLGIVVTDQPRRREEATPRPRAGVEESLDVVWNVKTEQRFSRTESGLIRVRRGRDRTGTFDPEDRAFEVVAGDENVAVVERQVGPEAVEAVILRVVADAPYVLTQREVEALAAEQVPLTPRAVINERREALLTRGQVVVERRTRNEGGRVMPRDVYAPGSA
jgi:hypothetical protein